MKKLVDKKSLELKYVANNGSWTYHIEIPDTSEIPGKWGTLKVSGSIDDYKIKSKNLLPMGEDNKIMAVNGEIRKAINKKAGDKVIVSLSLDKEIEEITKEEIFKIFEESEVLSLFKNLSQNKQSEIINEILDKNTDEKRVKAINKIVKDLGDQ